MKNINRKLFVAAIATSLLTGCSKNDNPEGNSLKSAMNESAFRLNKAVKDISALPAYNILTMSQTVSAKSVTADSAYREYIGLDKIKGEYDYNKVSAHNMWGMSLLHFFKKTADSEKMIVRMPLSKITKPWSLRHFSVADTALTNNFKIAVSGYHNNYNSFFDYDYLLASEISIDNEVAGNLNIDAMISPVNGRHYNSQYQFKGGYTVEYNYAFGDTTESGFKIMDNGTTLYGEKLLGIRNDTAKFGREHQYILTIGDVQIIRKDVNQVQVLVKGVLQPGAVVKIIDKEYDAEASVCKKRDIQITFEDGTVSTVSALIGESVNNIKTLYSSLHQVYFAAYIVDWIAYDIYYQR